MIIGLSGWARSGKDTIADYLEKERGFVKIAFADPMREALYKLDPYIQVGEFNRVSLASSVNHFGWETLKDLSEDVRPLMQRLGTEVGRNMFGEDFWVNLTMQIAENCENVVISDCRFVNEADAIRRAGGNVWRVVRKDVYAANDHVSERALDAYPNFDAILDNSSTIENLTDYVDELIGAY